MIETIKILENKGIGKKKINFRLKDWGVSRQRYWGCPIPIAYNSKGEIVKIPKKDLPVKLPEDVDLNVKGNPLEHQKKLAKYTGTLIDSSKGFNAIISVLNPILSALAIDSSVVPVMKHTKIRTANGYLQKK